MKNYQHPPLVRTLLVKLMRSGWLSPNWEGLASRGTKQSLKDQSAPRQTICSARNHPHRLILKRKSVAYYAITGFCRMSSFLDEEPGVFEEGASAAGAEAAAFFDDGADAMAGPADVAADGTIVGVAGETAAGEVFAASGAASSSSAKATSTSAAGPGPSETGAHAHGAVSKAEDVSELHFSGAMLAVKAEYLSNTEAAIVLNLLSEQSAQNGRPKEDERFTQSLTYANLLGFKSATAGAAANLACEELRTVLENNTFPSGAGSDVNGGHGDRLHKFEVAALANLQPAEPDEARALIPSLSRFDDADIRDMINTVTRSVARLEED